MFILFNLFREVQRHLILFQLIFLLKNTVESHQSLLPLLQPPATSSTLQVLILKRVLMPAI